MDQKVADEVCDRVLQFLADLSVPHAFTGGSLLGLIREGHFIDQDTDIDLLTYLPFVPFIFAQKETLKKYDLYFSRIQKGPKILRTRRKIRSDFAHGMKITEKIVFLWRISLSGTRDFEWHQSQSILPSPLRSQPVRDSEYLQYVDIYGMSWLPQLERMSLSGFDTFAPARPEAFLETIYGDWRNPTSRSDFDRPVTAEPAIIATLMAHSEYGRNFRDPQFPYISPRDTDSCDSLFDLLQEFPFLESIFSSDLQNSRHKQSQ